jgi:hypothetical protein
MQIPRNLVLVVAALLLIPSELAVTQPAPLASKIASWNAYSKQFIDAPVFHLLPIPGARIYRANIAQNGHEWHVESAHPDVSLAMVWNDMAMKKFSIAFEWVDTQGKVIASEPASVRVKAPDFGGFHEAPADWRAAADRGTAYLIEVAAHGKAPYREPGVPIWIWSAASPYKDAPDGLNVSYPCITVPNVIWGFMACLRAHGARSDEAMKLARDTADWSLKNRHANTGTLPLFPYSTVAGGQFEGGVEGESVNLLRASWYALGLLDLYEGAGRRDQKYLDYARHIATVTAKFQALDGSFPYRVNPRTGAIIETYTPAAIEFALLVDALKPYGISDDLLMAEQRAVRWMLSYVTTTHHWQAIFEDVSLPKPYANLSQFESQMLIRYLCKHRDEDPSYLPTAEALNRWVEDQFVLFGLGSEAFDRSVKTPLVFEQFVCWYPMEGHTASWIDSLLELHRATGKQVYLDKAMAAGNAICAQQFDDGSFSTWGARSCYNGNISGENTGGNWYNANIMAVAALYKLHMYCTEINKGHD